MKHVVGTMHEYLKDALDDVSLPGSEHCIDLMCQHWELVKRWNLRSNLTAVDDDRRSAWLHYRDSLQALAYLPEGSILDIGSGAGFPGIALAIAQPQRTITLLEPKRKKASFLRIAAARLGLANVRVLEARIQDVPDTLYDAATSRATFSQNADLQLCLNWLRLGAVFIAFRSNSSTPLPNSKRYPYRLADNARVLEIVRHSP